MTPSEREVVARVVAELETDVRLARTRDEHVRLVRRVVTLQELLSRVGVEIGPSA